ncbi:hypothetical protein CAPTEDRAFT_204200 [Capitella teleta]|uniref:Uncharacterized protein n=1 Tax=Capitella teleta TaxID=283909 RepID=R7USD8_CAPTE|nr:hypothetical protein CAPTEDRAFT_204200 [Capitella teleta]|eukprot:ELU06326.1 hypothetical protein CAPTEDRAFT_204200 [Capitella teleta]
MADNLYNFRLARWRIFVGVAIGCFFALLNVYTALFTNCTITKSPAAGSRTFSAERNRINSTSRMNVLLITYYRGGSSFLGEIFNQNPHVFYWYEPYIAIFDEMKEKLNISTDEHLLLFDSDGHIREEYFIASLELTRNIYNCDFDNIRYISLIHPFVAAWTKSKSFTEYRDCTLNNWYTTGRFWFKRCLPLALSKCNVRHIRVLKTVRTPMSYAERYLKEDPSLKVIHYIRDPRGILDSRRNISGALETSHNIKRLCELLKMD